MHVHESLIAIPLLIKRMKDTNNIQIMCFSESRFIRSVGISFTSPLLQRSVRSSCGKEKKSKQTNKQTVPSSRFCSSASSSGSGERSKENEGDLRNTNCSLKKSS